MGHRVLAGQHQLRGRRLTGGKPGVIESADARGPEPLDEPTERYLW